MASEKKLDCVILGLLSHSELTGYEIKKQMDTVLHYFWGASYGSIYPALSDLAVRGLATKRADNESGRNKWIYTITDEGHKYLEKWLKTEVEKDELRYETLLKLFFGSEVGNLQTLEHIEAFRKKIERDLPYLYEAEKTLEKIKDTEAAHKYYLLTVKFGIQTYRAYLEWCKDAEGVLRGDSKN